MLNLWGFSYADSLFKDYNLLLSDKHQGFAMWKGSNITHA
jgi:hypothetical protein